MAQGFYGFNSPGSILDWTTWGLRGDQLSQAIQKNRMDGMTGAAPKVSSKVSGIPAVPNIYNQAQVPANPAVAAQPTTKSTVRVPSITDMANWGNNPGGSFLTMNSPASQSSMSPVIDYTGMDYSLPISGLSKNTGLDMLGGGIRAPGTDSGGLSPQMGSTDFFGGIKNLWGDNKDWLIGNKETPGVLPVGMGLFNAFNSWNTGKEQLKMGKDQLGLQKQAFAFNKNILEEDIAERKQRKADKNTYLASERAQA